VERAPTSAGTRPLAVGLLLPDHERQFDGQTARWADLREMAAIGEAIGVDSIWVTDHLLHRAPNAEPRGAWECWSHLAALASLTDRVTLGTLVVCTAFRNPALLAKMAATVEEISDGRLILGLGAGWNEAEFRAFGYPFDHRVSRFAEALQIITGLLRHGHVDFSGTYYTARNCELRPRGPRPQGPPILIGSLAPRMLDLLARHGDAWNIWWTNTGNRAAGVRPFADRVDAAGRAAGRDPATIVKTAATLVAIGPERTSPPGVDVLSGSAAQIAAGLRAYAAVGVSHLQVRLQPNIPASWEAFAAVLEALDRDEQMLSC
jgi:alkanesulfonate monooxygenase SsuD/methylene tetrahydromethanopterin reductase-like flavin-dependent oxidoreductase (luciferase family)